MDFSAILEKIDVDAIINFVTDLLAKIDLNEIFAKIMELVSGLIAKG